MWTLHAHYPRRNIRFMDSNYILYFVHVENCRWNRKGGVELQLKISSIEATEVQSFKKGLILPNPKYVWHATTEYLTK